MEEKNIEQRQLMKIEEVSLEKMSLEQKQLADGLYHQLGLDPVVDKVLRGYSESLSGMDRATDKVFGPYDIKGRADAVAKVSALVTYAALKEQHDREVGNLESQMVVVAKERDKERKNHDKLVGKVAEVVGGDYEALKANYNEIVDRLADVEHLKSQVAILSKEKAELTERYESQIAGYESKLEGLESEKGTLAGELEQLKEKHSELESTYETLTRDYNQLKTAATMLADAIPYEEIKKKSGDELFAFLLKDSKVPSAVIEGVGKFIDFKKYLGLAAERGAKEALNRVEEVLGETLETVQ
ncbi:MAG: hypothetical protein GH152_03300 [Dehalococcoidia bacterium]|nr:hypothetical protein [Dehalococcoidia bacterium]